MTNLTCPMCANTEVDARQCRPGCMLAKSCTLVRCGRCGYEFPDPNQSFFATRLAKLFGKKEIPA